MSVSTPGPQPDTTTTEFYKLSTSHGELPPESPSFPRASNPTVFVVMTEDEKSFILKENRNSNFHYFLKCSNNHSAIPEEELSDLDTWPPTASYSHVVILFRPGYYENFEWKLKSFQWERLEIIGEGKCPSRVKIHYHDTKDSITGVTEWIDLAGIQPQHEYTFSVSSPLRLCNVKMIFQDNTREIRIKGVGTELEIDGSILINKLDKQEPMVVGSKVTITNSIFKGGGIRALEALSGSYCSFTDVTDVKENIFPSIGLYESECCYFLL